MALSKCESTRCAKLYKMPIFLDQLTYSGKTGANWWRQ